jgi:hypothetical protein
MVGTGAAANFAYSITAAGFYQKVKNVNFTDLTWRREPGALIA